MAKARGGDFSDILVRDQLVSSDQLAEARSMAESSGAKLQDILIKLGYVTQEQAVKAFAEFNKMEFVDLNGRVIPEEVINSVPESVARDNIIIPLEVDGPMLKIAMSDPTNFDLVTKLQFILNREIIPSVAGKEQITELINKHYGSDDDNAVAQLLKEGFADYEDGGAGGAKGPGLSDSNEGDAPIIRLVNLIIQEGVNDRASDIHIEPFAERIRVRYRIDGVLAERENPPRKLLMPLLSRIKIMAGMDIAEKRRCQDGRIKISFGKKHYDLRVSMLPTCHGQSCVMRILDRGNIMVSIKDLGFSETDYSRFARIIKRPNGIFLVTGPTGSGKTTTLYAAMNEMNKPDKKIITAEDPVEYYLPGINQVEVKHQIGLDFARIIRAMLRQAPNIILVGEIRDRETADIAVQASLTGHLVFSTLHTNDAPSAITRLIDIGVQPFLVASSVIAIMGQRLVRIVCSKCKAPATPPQEELKASGLGQEEIKNATFTKGKGCSNCKGTGYRGRRGIFEMLLMNGVMKEKTFKREPAQELRRVARAHGMKTLLEDGLMKACKGITTLEEVLSTCHHEPGH